MWLHIIVWFLSITLFIITSDDDAGVTALVFSTIFFWFACVFSIVIVAFILNRPYIFGKDTITGKINWLRYIVFLPFYFTSHVTWWIVVKRSKEEDYTEIFGKFHIGRYLSTWKGRTLYNTDLLIDMTCEFQEPFSSIGSPTYRCILSMDGNHPVDQNQFELVLEEATQWDGEVYVHCAQGHERSGAFLIALLIRSGSYNTIDEALEKLVSLRPGCRLQENQRKFLENVLNKRTGIVF